MYPNINDYHIEREVKDVDVCSVFIEDVKPQNEGNMMMKSALPVKYQFIPSSEKYTKNKVECVIDVIDAIYGNKLNKLKRYHFI